MEGIYSGLEDGQLAGTRMVYVFPNIQFNLRPDAGLVFQHLPDPAEPGRCIFVQFSVERERPHACDRPSERLANAPEIGPVTSADLLMAQRVQAGLRTGQIADFILSGQESCIRNMHRALGELVGGEH